LLAAIAMIAAATAAPAQEPVLSISGRVVAAGTGRPVVGAQTRLGQADFLGYNVPTDAAGVFHHRGLRPGRFRLVVSAPGYMTTSYGSSHDDSALGGATLIAISAGRPTFDATITLHRGATIAGRVVDDRKEPVVGVSVRAFAWRRVDGVARLMPVITGASDADDRGDYRIIGLPSGEFAVGVVDRTAVTFAPMAATAAGATRITLGEDAVRSGVNIQMRFPGRGAIEGLVSGPGAAGSPELMVRLHPEAAVPGFADLTTRPEPGGRFSFANISAGRYVLVVQPGQQPGQPRSFGGTEVVVAPGPEAARATITLREGARVAGRLTSDGARVVEMMTLQLARLEGSPPEATMVSTRAGADGRFVMAGVAPGRYQWRVCSGQQFGHMLCSVTHGGRDITDEPLVITTETRMDEVAIHAVAAPGGLAGVVMNGAGEPVTSGAVIIASTDPRHWTDATRRVVAVRPDTAGEFELRVLPPGEYLVAHIGPAPATVLTDPRFLKQLTGAKATVGAAGQSRVIVRIQAQR
jgi:hypothetical protein